MFFIPPPPTHPPTPQANPKKENKNKNSTSLSHPRIATWCLVFKKKMNFELCEKTHQKREGRKENILEKYS